MTCWNYMAKVRSSALCSICSGRSTSFIEKDKFLVSPQVCDKAVSSCVAFFEGLDTSEDDPMNPRQRMCLELARNFASISNQRHQEALSQLARALAAQQ